MDNAIFDGVWIELVPPDNFNIFNPCFGNESDDLDFSYLPGKHFYWYPVAGSKNIAFLDMKTGVYECPISKFDEHIDPYYKDLLESPIFSPLSNEDFNRISRHPLYSFLTKKYGGDRVKVRCGKFMCVD